ncbi:hypothetical protein SAMN05216283_10298 [Sunxiuqinia elliptica]|uniref:Uncharacterized protein n=1 Tax=Sunxiuqinia elliptica TaxID=655355 RepID=A0A1I2EI95_9BACT|nr:hypothetical protein SAMN05216283_10298 [Sunxiuqinia elliptica]
MLKEDALFQRALYDYLLRSCLSFIAHLVLTYFEMDFLIFRCRFSGLNQEVKSEKETNK